MDEFEACQEINNYFELGHEDRARNGLITLLDRMAQEGRPYSPLLNSMIRRSGLYPYMELESSDWQDRYACESFKSEVGPSQQVILHREQAYLLGELLLGNDIAVSAPTSFGKSFIIDAFITITSPKNVAIIVPTIALTDETRRRLQKKFGAIYNIVTTADQVLEEKNIFIFPQERAIGYASQIKELDILIVDEFYKASQSFDKDRSPALLRTIMRLGDIAKQRYFLAPNISHLKDSPFTDGMKFRPLDINTVFLKKTELYQEIGSDKVLKSKALLDILSSVEGKTLVYAGTYSGISEICELLLKSCPAKDVPLLTKFSEWLAINYDPNWRLVELAKRGVGVHNGQLHRSLSQIQVKLFEEVWGLDSLVSTSSIIEGVNTSAANVVLWSNRNGRAKLNNFTYKNIIGRSGRMFRHFVGNIFILEKPPVEEETQLELPVPDKLLGTIDVNDTRFELSEQQISKVDGYRDEMSDMLGAGSFNELLEDEVFQNTDYNLNLTIARTIKSDPKFCRGLVYLNSTNPENWKPMLFKVLKLSPGGWDTSHTKVVNFTVALSNNWRLSLPELLNILETYDIGIDEFFKLERTITFKLASLLGDINMMQERIIGPRFNDISSFISRVSHAFLPQVVYQLEEFGLPRSISKKIHHSGFVNFTLDEINLKETIAGLIALHSSGAIWSVPNLHPFDCYMINHFVEGVVPD